MICKNCKAKIPEESKYCEKCGLKIERDEIQVPHEIIESTASRKNNNKTNFLLVILVFKLTTLIISKKPGNTGISRDIRTEFTTDLLLSD